MKVMKLRALLHVIRALSLFRRVSTLVGFHCIE